LDEFLAQLVEWDGVVRFLRILHCRPICSVHAGLRLVLFYDWGGVLEALETIFDVFWHRDMYFLVWVIPLNGESTVSFSLFFDQALIEFLDRFQEVLGVLLTDIFDSKVVDDQ
jgi:hypothetical protein